MLNTLILKSTHTPKNTPNRYLLLFEIQNDTCLNFMTTPATTYYSFMPDGTTRDLPTFADMHRAVLGQLPQRVVSGGQTGADRAALDWAIKNGIAHGGWCPKGRLASDGVIQSHYQLRETESAGYRQRTKLNVRDSDATVIFNLGELEGGTLLTLRFAQSLMKPHHVVPLDASDLQSVSLNLMERFVLLGVGVDSFNMAGPREEKRPGIHARVMEVLDLWAAMCPDVPEPKTARTS